MRTLAIIAEYNPFHLGHKLHLDKSKKITGATHTVAIMSSSFVQRGEPAILDKWTRAKIAVDNGIDLVIELPVVYSLQTAELFAYGAIKILDSTNSIDFLSFGAETNDIGNLNFLANYLISAPNEYHELIRTFLTQGDSYPLAREKSIEILLGAQFKNLIKTSNNILGLEYLKALNKLYSDIKPVSIIREGSNYNDMVPTSSIASATAIRNIIFSKDLNDSKIYLPNETYKELSNISNFNNCDLYLELINYMLINLSKDDKGKYMDLNDDLLNRFISKSNIYTNFDNLIDSLKSKNYTMSRIKRILLHMLLGLTKNDVFEFINSSEEYVRILASNNKGFEILNSIKENSESLIINNFNKSYPTDSEILNKMLSYEVKATNLYNLVLPNKQVNLDYTQTIYTKKS